MSAWRRLQFVTSTQIARTRLAPSFVLVKRVLRVTVIPVKVNDHKNIDWTKTLVTSVTSIIAIIWNGLLSSQERCGITFLFSVVLSSTIWPQLMLVGLRLSRAAHFIKTGGHFVVSKEITINNCVFLCRCRSFNPSLCRLSPFCCPLSLFQGHFTSVSKFSLTGPQRIGQNKCN